MEMGDVLMEVANASLVSKQMTIVVSEMSKGHDQGSPDHVTMLR